MVTLTFFFLPCAMSKCFSPIFVGRERREAEAPRLGSTAVSVRVPLHDVPPAAQESLTAATPVGVMATAPGAMVTGASTGSDGSSPPVSPPAGGSDGRGGRSTCSHSVTESSRSATALSVPLPQVSWSALVSRLISVSLPSPALSASTPSPPSRVSLPPPPFRVFGPAPPVRVSPPVPPISISTSAPTLSPSPASPSSAAPSGSAVTAVVRLA